MKSQNNIGNWTAIVKTDGKAPQIIINGVFPTYGESPFYHLVKNDSQENQEELLLTLVFGFLVVPNGSIYKSAVFTETINTTEQYKSVLIVDDSEEKRVLATILISDKHNSADKNFIPELEPIMGVEITDSRLKIRTYTGGCTFKDSFKINVIKGFTGIPPYIVEVYRTVPDYCKGHFPEGILLEYELSELDIEPFATFSLTNKIGRIR